MTPFDQDQDEAQPYRLDDELRTELARKIVLHEMLVADLTNPAWQTSLALIIAGLDESAIPDIGLILVPLAPHMGGYWINGTAPGMTVAATLIHRDDVDELSAVVDRMGAALQAAGVVAGEDHDV
jgi:hypothetical protein